MPMSALYVLPTIAVDGDVMVSCPAAASTTRETVADALFAGVLESVAAIEKENVPDAEGVPVRAQLF